MLYNVVVMVLFTAYFFFRLGYKAGKGIEPKAEIPILKKNKKVSAKHETLLKNIENYDGTNNNQTRL